MLLLFAAFHFKISNGFWFQDVPLLAWNNFRCVCVCLCVFNAVLFYYRTHNGLESGGTKAKFEITANINILLKLFVGINWFCLRLFSLLFVVVSVMLLLFLYINIISCYAYTASMKQSIRI